MMKSSVHLALVCGLVVFAGCGKRDDRIRVYPTTGVVTVKGQPASGATVVFYPLDESLRGHGKPLPTGVVGEDGKFALASYGLNDGAPAGEYEVSIVWMEPTKPADPDFPEPPPTRDRLRDRYSAPAKSGLKATVQAQPTELAPFELP